MDIILPYHFTPRDYQLKPLVALDSGLNRINTVWHRRSGKDLTAMNYAIKCMFPTRGNPKGRMGTYYHLFPTYAQGKKIIWDGMTDPDERGYAKSFLDFFPKELFPVKKRNETELRIECVNGSAYQIVGTDKLDAIVGTNPVGCIFSEYSLQNPKAKDLLMPILVQNGGWSWFIYTPRGRNHGWDLWSKNQNNPNWFRQLLTIKDTRRRGGHPVVTEEQVKEEIAAGMEADWAQQEYYCSFDIGIAGAYYSKLLSDSEAAGKIGRGMFDPLLPVDTWWDIGVDDCTAIWFTQQCFKEIRVIDYVEGSGEGLPYWASVIAEKRMNRRYAFRSFNFPWDMQVKEFATGKTRIEQAKSLGLNPAKVIKRIALVDQIAACRALIPKCWFDYDPCQQGIEALRNYSKTYDEKRRVFLDQPVHDWASHAASAFATLAVGIREEEPNRVRQDKAETAFDVFTYNQQTTYRQETAETDFNIFG